MTDRWGNPGMPWPQLAAHLNGTMPVGADGNDAPAWSRRRDRYQPPPLQRAQPDVAYAELHAHSHFSFLDGVSSPEALVEEAARRGIETLALTDHDGMYGVVRFAEAARQLEIGTVFGAELSLAADQPRTGVPDPPGHHLVVLARNPAGYTGLCEAITDAQLAGRKQAPRYAPLEALGAQANNDWVILTGCRKSPVVQALIHQGPQAARRVLQRLISVFGRDHVVIELIDHGDPLDQHRNDALVELAVGERLAVIVTNNVHYARPADARMAQVAAAIRAGRTLDEMDGWMAVTAGAHLRSGAEQHRRFSRYPGVIEATAELGRQLRFDLKLIAPNLPDFAVPDGQTPMQHLRNLVEAAAVGRYGPRHAENVPGAWRQLDHELKVIATLGFAGYFLIVHDIVMFCQNHNILCQGRGSAANSAVCYVLGITKADAVRLGLLFERFLTPERDGPPDIDLDIESARREEVIQYVYARYGRRHAAQVANVITYRSRSAVRDAGRALGYSRGQLDAWSRSVTAWSRSAVRSSDAAQSQAPDGVPEDVLAVAAGLIDAPRHLGIHSGGMVLCDRPISQVVPIEHARMDGRTVLQWDKDDCATVGLVKFDLLGLGMLSALHETVDLIEAHHGVTVDLAALEQEDAVYDMLCRADAIGVFQVESRAQLATLPRLQPRTFYDLVVEVAIIRPGPIQGGSVHPYIRRRNGEEPVEYLHPLLKKSLERTLGVPLFQEQLMQMAVDVAGLTPSEADQLRQAMGAKRSTQRMERLRQRLYDGMALRGIAPEVADRIYAQIAAFADFGFPESHSVSFAYLVYASAWCKLHYPAAFLAGLLNHQPMGFYSPQSLVADARRHGVVVHRPQINRSRFKASLERDPNSASSMAVRLGLQHVKGVGKQLAERIVANAPYRTMEDVVRRCGASSQAMEALAAAGAFTELSQPGTDHDARSRRNDVWRAGAAVWQTADRIAGTAPSANVPELAPLTDSEVTATDLVVMGISPTSAPMAHLRAQLQQRGVVAAADLATVVHGRKVDVAGIVSHRQQPATARGTVFVNLEDETGMINVICSPGVWAAHLEVAVAAPALMITGRVERSGQVVSVIAQRLRRLPVNVITRSRDFR